MMRESSALRRESLVTSEEDPADGSIRLVIDERRVVEAIKKAAKKHTSGSVFSVKIEFDDQNSLKLGVKDVPGNILFVSMLKRTKGNLGPAETAGVRLGDVIFGANFIPLRDGSKTLIHIITSDITKNKKHIHMQFWRCHQISLEPVPGALFPRADDLIVRAHFLYRSKLLSEREKWNFIEIQLCHMLDDLKLRAAMETATDSNTKSIAKMRLRTKQFLMMDLEKTIMQARGLRSALCVRVVNTRTVDDTVTYALRVEDVESGLQWVVHRRYSDFHTLHAELCEITHFMKEVKFVSSRLTLRPREQVVESRIVSLDTYIRKLLSVLTEYATMDQSAGHALKQVQNFLAVDTYLDCLRPPVGDDQRFVELLAFRLLTDVGSSPSQQCARFVSSVNLDGLVQPGDSASYKAMLQHLQNAMAEVEDHVLGKHEELLVRTLRYRNRELSKEEIAPFVRRCVRRQVEAAIYLPLRRTVIRLVYPFIAAETARLQQAMKILQPMGPTALSLHPDVCQAPSFRIACQSLKEMSRAFLPADQGQLLLKASRAMLDVYSECKVLSAAAFQRFKICANDAELRRRSRSSSFSSKNGRNSSSSLPVTRIARPDILLSLLRPINPTNSNRAEGSLARRESGDVQGVPSGDADFTIRRTLFSPGPKADFNGSSTINDRRQTPCHIFAAESGSQKAQMHQQHSTDLTSSSHQTLPPLVVPRVPEQTANQPYPEVDYGSKDIARDPVATLFPVDETVTWLDPAFQRLTDEPVSPPDEFRLSIQSPIALDESTQSIESISTCCARGRSKSLDCLSSSVGLIAPTRSVSSSGKTSSIDLVASCPSQVHCQPTPLTSNSDFASPSNAVKGADISGAPAPSSTNTTPSSASPSVLQYYSLSSRLSKLTLPLSPLIHQSNDKDTPIEHLFSSSSLGSDFLSPSTSDGGLGRSGKSDNVMKDYTGSMDESPGAMSADDFLPLFAYILIYIEQPQLRLVSELMTHLLDNEEAFGECGYYMATLEAALQHIGELGADLAARREAVSTVLEVTSLSPR